MTDEIEEPDLLGALQDSINRARAARRVPDPTRRCRCDKIRHPHYVGDWHPAAQPETSEET